MDKNHLRMLEVYLGYLNYHERKWMEENPGWPGYQGYPLTLDNFTKTDPAQNLYGHVKELMRHGAVDDWWGLTILLEVGYGDDGGPSLLIGRFDGEDVKGEDKLESLTQTFDTITSAILLDGKEVYRED
jgi:hypothetical protein